MKKFKELFKKYFDKFWYLFYKIVCFICGTELNTQKVNRSVFWTFVLILVGYIQLHDVNKTTKAEFAHKIKNDFFTEANINLLTLLDEKVLVLDTTHDVAWFDLDTIKYKLLHKGVSLTNIPLSYQSNQMDELLQNFEDLGLYEKKGLIDIDYIDEGYDFYIESVWENKEIGAYIRWLWTEPRSNNVLPDDLICQETDIHNNFTPEIKMAFSGKKIFFTYSLWFYNPTNRIFWAPSQFDVDILSPVYYNDKEMREKYPFLIFKSVIQKKHQVDSLMIKPNQTKKYEYICLLNKSTLDPIFLKSLKDNKGGSYGPQIKMNYLDVLQNNYEKRNSNNVNLILDSTIIVLCPTDSLK